MRSTCVILLTERMRRRKGEKVGEGEKKIKNTENEAVETGGNVTQQKQSWWSHLKYLLLLFIPAFLNHAALYREARELKPPGELYDVGWGQKLFMGCSGQGLPTVIFDAPTGMSSDAWVLIASEVAKVTKTCVYDRAGLGFSDRPFVNRSEPETQNSKRGKLSTTERMVDDFYRLFSSSSDQSKPFLLVGSELGAVNMRFYTQMFEDSVAGLVLVNPLVEGMFSLHGGQWTGLWYEKLMSSFQTLQFSAAVGFSRIALILGLMKPPMKHEQVSQKVLARQKYLYCKPGHLSSAVDEYYFTNDSLSQMRTVWRVKPFPSTVPVSLLSSETYAGKVDKGINQVWSSSQTQISNVLHSGCEKIHLSGDADTALFDHAATVVKVIKRHVQRWRRKAGMKTVKQ